MLRKTEFAEKTIKPVIAPIHEDTKKSLGFLNKKTGLQVVTFSASLRLSVKFFDSVFPLYLSALVAKWF
jgi:hypothetical protein